MAPGSMGDMGTTVKTPEHIHPDAASALFQTRKIICLCIGMEELVKQNVKYLYFFRF